MPVLNRIAAFAPEMAEWRRWLHRHPELEFDLPQTAAFRKMAAAFRGKDLSGRIPACFPCCSYHKYHFEIK